MLTSRHLNVNPPRENVLVNLEKKTGTHIPRPKEISIPYAIGDKIATFLLGRILSLELDTRVCIAGSLRRERKEIHDIDILISPYNARLADAIRTWGEPIINGTDKISILYNTGSNDTGPLPHPIQVDFRFIAQESWGPALQYFTGSADHNIRLRATAKRLGFLLNEHGLFDSKGKRIDDNTEGGIYKALGLRWLPPKYRDPTPYQPKPTWCVDHTTKDFCRRQRMNARRQEEFEG